MTTPDQSGDTLDSLLRGLTDRGRRFTVYRREGDDDVLDRFPNRNVEVATETLPPDGPDPFLVVEEDGTFAGMVSLADVDSLLEPPIARPGERDGVSEGYRVFFDALDDTVFTSIRRRELLAVSREIEDRAYRVGHGTLRVCFQSLSTFRTQLPVYRVLVDDTALDVHVYGAADWEPPAVPGITYHALEEGEDDPLARFWVLAFDGGGHEERACGLVARETGDAYTGFWTDDPTVVKAVATALDA
ncbi:DICT sensory domain-containing protein [Halobaculum marinum]|uniref:DICT sensory domain-containing protein n=1 Tax=Halobaculum marinum TaxID=3031996 RepID=A0ABD5WRZ4_9EURY|nr:DICT sensory domain-containing protein [Halobaculum sp. DT55]